MITLLTLNGASADEPDALQQEINDVLAKTQGGVQISRNEIAWNDGKVIMAFPLPGETQAPTSSPAAQKLQAQSAGLSDEQVKTRIAEEKTAAALGFADEPLPSDEPTGGTVSPLATDTCPTEVFGNDWYCFYQFKNFGGRRLQWNAFHHDRIFFSKYDFVNRTSSWSNKGGMEIWVMGRIYSGDDDSCEDVLWTEDAHTRSASAYPDNTADCFFTP
ncbi:hypothetical protein ACFYWP_36740 [Actinacidiphila glaucinigra]|uniref:hypothetical protein n=1 Tax=Actinacidiphila glaucinigra TaxID=235986 RepID=UPI0036871FDD